MTHEFVLKKLVKILVCVALRKVISVRNYMSLVNTFFFLILVLKTLYNFLYKQLGNRVHYYGFKGVSLKYYCNILFLLKKFQINKSSIYFSLVLRFIT